LELPVSHHEGLIGLARSSRASEFAAIALAVLVAAGRFTGAARQSVAIQDRQPGLAGQR
jgi:hypothetical protein